MTPPLQHQELVDRLVADLVPVRRLWSFRVRLAVWIAGSVALLALVAGTSCRPDLATQLRSPWFVAHLAALLGAAVLVGGVALRAAVPGAEPHRLVLVAAGVATAAALLLGFAAPSDPVAAPVFVARGVRCVTWTLVFAMPAWLALMAAVRRGAPVAPRAAATCAGAAAVLLAAGVLRTACPIEDRWHLAVWHLAPVLAAAAFSGVIVSASLRRWRAC